MLTSKVIYFFHHWNRCFSISTEIRFSRLIRCLFDSIVCSQFKNGSITIVSSEKALSNHIQSTTRALDIPHIQTHLDVDGSDGNKEFSINIFPSQTVLNRAMFDVMKFLNWTRCAIIYEQDTGECRWLSFRCLINWNVNWFRNHKSPRSFELFAYWHSGEVGRSDVVPCDTNGAEGQGDLQPDHRHPRHWQHERFPEGRKIDLSLFGIGFTSSCLGAGAADERLQISLFVHVIRLGNIRNGRLPI